MSKIAWQDGMPIYAQHFQQQDIFLEKLVARYYSLSPHHTNGFFEYAIDEGALSMRKLVLTSCKGVLPDGTLFDAPKSDELPQALNVPPDYNGLIYLGTALGRATTLEASDQRTKQLKSRYLSSEISCADVNKGYLEVKKVNTCLLNLNLLLEADELSEMCYLPLAKVFSSPEGLFLEEGYIPPLLRAQNSLILVAYASKVLGLLTKYVNVHARLLDSEGASVGRYESFLILQAICRCKYTFAMLSQDPYLTPNALFCALIDLIGSLSIFTNVGSMDERQLRYTHHDIAGSFTPLIELIEQIFLALTRKVAIRLQFTLGENVHTLAIPDKVTLEGVDFTVGITFTEKPADYQAVISQVKIASAEEIKRIIAAQVSGVRFAELKTLPSHIVYDENTVYLQLAPEGPIWQRVLTNRDLGLYSTTSARGISQITLWIISK